MESGNKVRQVPGYVTFFNEGHYGRESVRSSNGFLILGDDLIRSEKTSLSEGQCLSGEEECAEPGRHRKLSWAEHLSSKRLRCIKHSDDTPEQVKEQFL